MRSKQIWLTILTIMGFFVITSLFSFAAEPNKQDVVKMTLEEAFKYAKDHNKTIKDLKEQVDDVKDAYDKMVRRTQEIQNIPNKVNFRSMDEYALYKGYTLKKTKYGYDEFLKTQELTEQTIYYNIEKLVYEISQTEKDISYLEQTRKKLNKDLQIAKVRLNLKMISQNQFSQLSSAVNQINTKLKLMNNVLKIKKDALKSLLGIDRKVKLIIDPGEKVFKEIGQVDIEKLKEEAVKNRLDAVKLTNALNSKKMDFELYDHFKNYLPFDDYKSKLDAYNRAKEEYENDIDDIKQKVEDAYEAVLTSENEYKDALEVYNNVLENYKINKLKYSLGMMSLIDFMNSELEYIKAQIDLDKALDKNILANKKFLAACSIGDVEITGATGPTQSQP